MIHEAETEYQYARVVEYDDGTRTLELNEGQAEHSRARRSASGPAGRGPSPCSRATTGTATWWTAVRRAGATRRGAWRSSATPPARPRAPTRSSSRARASTAWRSTPSCREIGRRYFDMNNPRLHLYHEDARPFLRRIDARYDVISVDAYRQPYIPFYLTTKEFFETVRDRLAPGGVRDRERRPSGGPGRAREGADARRWARSSRTCMRDPIEDTNTLLVASDGAAVGRTDRPGRADACRARSRPTAEAAAQRLEPPLRGRRRLHRRQGAGGVAGRQVDHRLRERGVSAPADVAIIGGGIVGCAAAAFLAEAGVNVEVYEREEVGGGGVRPQLRLDPAPVRPGAGRAAHGDARSTTAAWTTWGWRARPPACSCWRPSAIRSRPPWREIARRLPGARARAARPGGRAGAGAGGGGRAVGVPARDGLPGPPIAATRAFARRAHAAGARFHEAETAWPWVARAARAACSPRACGARRGR